MTVTLDTRKPACQLELSDFKAYPVWSSLWMRRASRAETNPGCGRLIPGLCPWRAIPWCRPRSKIVAAGCSPDTSMFALGMVNSAI